MAFSSLFSRMLAALSTVPARPVTLYSSCPQAPWLPLSVPLGPLGRLVVTTRHSGEGQQSDLGNTGLKVITKALLSGQQPEASMGSGAGNLDSNPSSTMWWYWLSLSFQTYKIGIGLQVAGRFQQDNVGYRVWHIGAAFACRTQVFKRTSNPIFKKSIVLEQGRASVHNLVQLPIFRPYRYSM